MKKFYYSLLVLFMGITTAAFADDAAVVAWDGSNIEYSEENDNFWRPDDSKTFEYEATEEGILYIYSDDQNAQSQNMQLSISGGWYHDGGYDADAPLMDAGTYPAGTYGGVYGWIKLYQGDRVRFTITASQIDEEDSRCVAEFTLKSAFFGSSVGGDTWGNPMALTVGEPVLLPVYDNAEFGHATFCSFVAPLTGNANIICSEYSIFYAEKSGAYNPEQLAQNEVWAKGDNDNHVFAVEKGKSYIVLIPNSCLMEAALEVEEVRAGESTENPIELTSLPATLDLVAGDNFFAFEVGEESTTTILEVAAAAGWNGSIEYYEYSKFSWGSMAEKSSELATDNKENGAATFVKNLDANFNNFSSWFIVNFKASAAVSDAATLTLREPKAGEAAGTAKEAVKGDNTISGAARDYWFVYTVEEDAEYSFATSSKSEEIKHVCLYDEEWGSYNEIATAQNTYRVATGGKIYVCVAKNTSADGKLTITSNEIVAGDYEDKAVEFELGDNIKFTSRGRSYYSTFTAEESGFAIFTSKDYSLQFQTVDGKRVYPTEKTETEVEAEGDAANGLDTYFYVEYTYKVAVDAGQSYIVEVMAVGEGANTGEEITVTTALEAAQQGDFCDTAIELVLDEKTEIAYEFEKIKWFKITADKDGYYIVKAKLGSYGRSMKTKVGDCDAVATSAGNDNDYPSPSSSGNMKAKVYLTAGETVYIETKTGRESLDYQTQEDAYARDYGTDLYITVSYSEPRAGEDAAIAIEADPYTSYSVMSSNTQSPDYDANYFNKWYTYTIPAGKAVTISILSESMNAWGLTFKKEDLSNMYQYNGGYVETKVTNAEGTQVGKTYEFAATDADRTFYIYAPVVNYATEVYWKIEGDDLPTGVVVEEVAPEATVIYDLMGRRVENPTKGIYIINGVKRVIE